MTDKLRPVERVTIREIPRLNRDELQLDTTLEKLNTQIQVARRFIEAGEANINAPGTKELVGQLQKLMSSEAWAALCW